MEEAPPNHSMMARAVCLLIIIIASLLGVCTPLYLVEKDGDVTSTEWYQTLKTTATGLVLGVAYLHLLDDADQALRQEAGIERYHPVTGRAHTPKNQVRRIWFVKKN